MIITGDSLNELKNLEADSIDAVITDPPYGYSFMGKDWDKAVPSVEIWQECLRVLKPGAFACVMSAPRSDVQQAMTERLIRAGFRLDFTPIYWTYASGFPKAGDTAKLVDKRLGVEPSVIGTQKLQGTARRMKGGNFGDFGGEDTADVINLTEPVSPEAKALKGSKLGFQPKPAVEVVIIAMKPLSEKTYVDQALKNGKGITWLDDCRVPLNGEKKTSGGGKTRSDNSSHMSFRGGQINKEDNSVGRFPANLLVSDDVLNDGTIRTARKGLRRSTSDDGHSLTFNHANDEVRSDFGDSGSYSRYFDLDAWARERLPAEQAMTFPFAIFPKASKSEKNKGLEHMPVRTNQEHDKRTGQNNSQIRPDGSERTPVKHTNHHPTVKPLKLMAYLITLFSREGDTVLDPFVGSGTTVVAAKHLGRNGIGIEREPEYAEIAKARLSAEVQGVLL